MDRNDEDYWWETVDIRPVPPGWRVVHIVDQLEGPRISVRPMAGWLVEERQRYYEGDDRDGRPREPYAERRVIAGEPDPHGYAQAVDLETTFWCLLAPDEPEPSREALEQEVARRARVSAEERRQRKEERREREADKRARLAAYRARRDEQ